MRLLVSVASAAEASSALAGGADLIDAKDPRSGALGAVSLDVLRQIRRRIGAERPVTAALGDAADEETIEAAARAFAASGAALVKIGFAGIRSRQRVSALIAAAVRGVHEGSDGHAGVVAVAYADAAPLEGLNRSTLLDAAAHGGAEGVLLDTLDKHGPGLCQLVSADALATWVLQAHQAGLFVALAGRLTAVDLAAIRDTGADIAGVRGAACEGGRTGQVAADRVRMLLASCAQQAGTSRGCDILAASGGTT